MRCDKYTPYKVYFCCPDLALACNELAPVFDLEVQRPPLNGFGSFTLTFRGLTLRYRVTELWSSRTYLAVGQIQVGDLNPGTYTLSLRSLVNPDCEWRIDVVIPDPILWQTQLVYGDTGLPVPAVNSPFLTPFITPDFQIRQNSDRILALPIDLNLTFTVLVLGTFTPPINTEFFDFLQYGPVPPNLVAPGFPPQTPFVPANNQRPPIITLRYVSAQPVQFIDSFQVNLVPNNGNGWIRARVWDSSLPTPFETTYWIYIAESVLP